MNKSLFHFALSFVLGFIVSSCSLYTSKKNIEITDSVSLTDTLSGPSLNAAFKTEKINKKVKQSEKILSDKKIIARVSKYLSSGCLKSGKCYFELLNAKNGLIQLVHKVVLFDAKKCLNTKEDCHSFDMRSQILGPENDVFNISDFDPKIFEGALIKVSGRKVGTKIVIDKDNKKHYVQILSLKKKIGKYRKKLNIFKSKNISILYKDVLQRYLSPKNLNKVKKPKLDIIRKMLLNNSVHNTQSLTQFKEGQQIVSDPELVGSFKQIYSSRNKMKKKSPYWVFSETWEDYDNSRIIEVKSVFDTTLKLKKIYMNIKR